MATDSDSLDHVKTSLQFASELLVPGGSNLIKGDYKQAGLHAVLGLAARAIFGLPGLIVVSANSFTKAKTGRSLLEHLNLLEDSPHVRTSYEPPVVGKKNP
jgi:hypothetical protein